MKIARILIVLLLGAASCLSAAATGTTTTISSSLNPSAYGQTVTFTATVASKLGGSPPDGTVTFMQGATVLATQPLSSGSASFATSTLKSGGTDSIHAVYSGDSSFSGSSSLAVKQVVNRAATTTTLASSQNPSNSGQSVTFTAIVAVGMGLTATGNVAFYNGSTLLGTVALSGGAANYTTTKLPVGQNSITALYKGNSSFATSTSSALNQMVGVTQSFDSTMTWDGVTRYYRVFVPAGLPANPPMLLMLHGTHYTTTFDPQVVISLNWGWNSIAEQYGFILVQPASTWNPQTGQWNWNSYFMDGAFPAPAPDDSGFLRQLIANLTTQYNVNPKQVYVTGFSSGAQMTERVGNELSDVVAAIAPFSGQLVGQRVPPPMLPPNPPAHPMSVLEWHGTLDQSLWPCGNGTTKYSAVTFTLDTVDDTFNYWANAPQNSCTTLQTTQPLCLNGSPNDTNNAATPGLPGMTGNIATGCANSNTTVQFIWEPGVAHTTAPKTYLKNVTTWLFFAAHPKP
jgi:poly(hydroxyalkanoate) depolymerase family esterase